MSDSQARPPESAGQAFARLFPLLLLTTLLCYYRPGQDPRFMAKSCGTNLHKISVKLERTRLGSEDKLYPTSLKEAYDKAEIPECPAAGADTYSVGYTASSDRRSYLLVCKGDHHVKAEIPTDFPRVAFSVDEAKGKVAEPTPKESPVPVETSSTPGPSATPEPSGTPMATETPSVESTPAPVATPAEQATPAPSATPSDS